MIHNTTNKKKQLMGTRGYSRVWGYRNTGRLVDTRTAGHGNTEGFGNTIGYGNTEGLEDSGTQRDEESGTQGQEDS